jgi:plasmid stabilization system protein ParE
MKLRLTPAAEQDLESIGDHIARENPARALDWIRALRQRCQRIAEHPQIFRRRPELGERVRVGVLGHYLICFEADEDEVTVLRVLHGARDLSTLFQVDAEGG